MRLILPDIQAISTIRLIYFARLMGPKSGMPFAIGVGFRVGVWSTCAIAASRIAPMDMAASSKNSDGICCRRGIPSSDHLCTRANISAMQRCAICDDEKWICENHPNKPWVRIRGRHALSACNMPKEGERLRMPSDFISQIDEEKGQFTAAPLVPSSC